MSHRNAPLTPAGRLRLIDRCRTRPIAHVAAEAGISASVCPSGSTGTSAWVRAAWMTPPAPRKPAPTGRHRRS